jgi:hypothetical protein
MTRLRKRWFVGVGVVVGLGLLSGLLPGLAVAQIKNPSEAPNSRIAAQNEEYRPISNNGRFAWFANSTIGPKGLAAGVVSAAWGTALNNPEEYGPHWEGFGKRYGMRLIGVASGNAIEAGLGRVWGEDPRYFNSTANRPLPRLRHAAAMVFFAYRADGHRAPAFARYTGIVGNNFISNAWRVPSESSASAALTRSALGFAGRFASNVFDEFWKDIRQTWQEPVRANLTFRNW